MESAKECNHKLEDRSEEVTLNAAQKDNEKKNSKKTSRYSEKSNLHLARVPKEENRREAILK